MSEIIKRFYPTIVPRPLWERAAARRVALSNFRVSEIKVRLISSEFDIRKIPVGCKANILRSNLFPRIEPTLDWKVYFESISREAPVDGTEIVDWMHYSAASNAIIEARCEEYNRLGSQLIGASGDPYIPGVSVEDIYYIRQTGSQVSSQRYGTVSTPRGNFNVTAGGKGDGIFRDLLTWGAISWVGYTQWDGALLKWKSLASTPINSAVGFVSISGISAPQYFVLSPSRPALRVSVTQSFTSDKDQRIFITWRDPDDFTRVLHQDWIDIPAGTTELSYTLISFPYVPSTVQQIYPSDNTQTRLNYFTTSP